MQRNVDARSGAGDLASAGDVLIALSEDRLRLRLDHFDLVTRMIGYTTWQAKAEFIGVDPATLSRVRRDGGRVSERVVAAILAALDRHRGWFAEKNTSIAFEALFTIVTPVGAAEPERVA
jgi:hypothetical protein